MKTPARIFLSILALATTQVLAACGAQNSDGTLQFITLSPTAFTAPASGGTVQFTASGHYTDPAHTVSPLQVKAPMASGWSYTGPEGMKISLSNNGLASCGSAVGTFVVAAWAVSVTDGPVCNVISPGGAPCGSTFGTAQLVCK